MSFWICLFGVPAFVTSRNPGPSFLLWTRTLSSRGDSVPPCFIRATFPTLHRCVHVRSHVCTHACALSLTCNISFHRPFFWCLLEYLKLQSTQKRYLELARGRAYLDSESQCRQTVVLRTFSLRITLQCPVALQLVFWLCLRADPQ